jgi:hypothetical protein
MNVGVPFLLAAVALQLNAAPSIGAAKIAPTTAIIGTPTQITVTASISDPSLIPTGVNLLQLNPDGSTTILGTLHDDGLNGDLFAGDLVFTLVVTLNAPSASQIQLQVSAAFKGLLQRVKSPIMSVYFQSANAPQQAITALAQYLIAGDTTAALTYIAPSNNTITVFDTLGQTGLNTLAAMLKSAVLISSQNDLRVFHSTFITPSGTSTTLELSMMPFNGQWMISNW